MKDLEPLSEIHVPAPRPEALYTIDAFGEQVAFRGLKRLFGAADYSKQSVAGTEKTLLGEFDVSVDLLDRAYRTMAEKGALRGEAEQFMYFETGQGSELSYGKHEGIDMTTTEALCYGLCRRWGCLNTDRMLAYFDTSGHDDQTLREIHGKLPGAELLEWALSMDISRSWNTVPPATGSRRSWAAAALAPPNTP